MFGACHLQFYVEIYSDDVYILYNELDLDGNGRLRAAVALPTKHAS